MDWLIVIPARLNSSRLPRKPLIDICGKSMIERTYLCALEATCDRERIIIATDSEEIKEECKKFNANCLITSKKCLTGTDRVAEVANIIKAEQYINLQGDEPIFPQEEIRNFINESTKNKDLIHTAIYQIKNSRDFFNRSIPKMVFSKNNKLLYSSRAPIPFNKNGEFKFGYKHVCIYAFNKRHLNLFSDLTKKTELEEAEDLEINRFLELEETVNCIKLNQCGKAVDNNNDLEEVTRIIHNLN